MTTTTADAPGITRDGDYASINVDKLLADTASWSGENNASSASPRHCSEARPSTWRRTYLASIEKTPRSSWRLSLTPMAHMRIPGSTETQTALPEASHSLRRSTRGRTNHEYMSKQLRGQGSMSIEARDASDAVYALRGIARILRASPYRQPDPDWTEAHAAYLEDIAAVVIRDAGLDAEQIATGALYVGEEWEHALIPILFGVEQAENIVARLQPNKNPEQQ